MKEGEEEPSLVGCCIDGVFGGLVGTNQETQRKKEGEGGREKERERRVSFERGKGE